MTIFDIDEAILNLVDEETGEIVDIEALEALEMERDRKVSNIACWIKQLDAEAEAIKAEKKKLADRQTAKENKAKALREFLARILNGEKFEDSRCKISYRRSESVEVADDIDFNFIPDEYIKVTKAIDKMAIKTAIKAGHEYKGVQLVQNTSIQVK
jgi:hypothetical protein